MQKIKKRAIAVLVLAVLPALSVRAGAEDPHVWLGGGVSHAFDANRTFRAFYMSDTRFSAKRLEQEHNIFGVAWRAAPWLELSPGWRLVTVYTHKQKRGAGHSRNWYNEYRPDLEATFFWQFGGWRFANRHRVVLRQFEGGEDYLRYRSRLLALSPWCWTRWAANPYGSVEAFLDDGKKSGRISKRDKFDQLWLSGGIKFKPSDLMRVDCYYMLQELKDTTSHGWHPAHVVGIAISFDF